MVGPISPINFPVLAEPIGSTSGAGSSPGAFQEALTSAINNVESSGHQASASVERFLNGEGEELHSTVLATERAQLNFDLFMQARNKVVSAYQEIMRMQM
jgi:flagellar hook-basal body complex protein FliE